MSNRLKVYRDPDCRVPVESFSFGKLSEGKPYRIPFYIRNEGFVQVSDIVLGVESSNRQVQVKLVSDHIESLRSHRIYEGVIEVYATQPVHSVNIELTIDGVICFLR